MSQSDGKGGQRTINVAVAKTLVSKNQRNDFETENLVAFGHSGGETLKLNKLANTLNAQTGSETTAMIQGVVAYNIQHNDGGEHKRKDRPSGGMYVNETETALTVGSTDLTAVLGDGRIGRSTLRQGRTTEVYSNHFGVRRLAPVECERLQGFPDGWTDGFADSTRYKMLGNAVAVPCAEWIGTRICR